MPCGSDIMGSPRTRRRCRRFKPLFACDVPDPLLRPQLRMRNDVKQPDSCSSFRSIRGYRPGDFFTRGTTLGGNTRACPVASCYECFHPADGYSSWRPSSCAGVPRITACTRCFSPLKSERFECPLSSDDDGEEEEEVVVQAASSPTKCECKTHVETKPVTSDAFTMTDKLTRDQGTMAQLEVSDQAVDATLVMRDVATDTDDSFEEAVREAAADEFRFSGSRSRTFSRRSIKFEKEY